ncbi:hypothetical protein SODALDRAFT_327802 [Sodiomyces alkalinus F11]|uniref:Uncharacterized protein n=1 Tax=Sodiomyces alkalinus (strain CBS 110278 / VKM F-3762 / F11) TaxID=1314773 RepID=A0A3N2QA52_SODAK|nr:hypothetical protein SODALDRAFT_327802 [Sodiomyces alkalinus F11]ROT43597.1 hypothetical protein SODALDRAFT_327802 [Sodiomyces alkalinus F11]
MGSEKKGDKVFYGTVRGVLCLTWLGSLLPVSAKWGFELKKMGGWELLGRNIRRRVMVPEWRRRGEGAREWCVCDWDIL